MNKQQEYQKSYKAAHKEEAKINRKKYYSINKEKEKKNNKIWYDNHPGYFHERWLKYYHKNKSWLLEYWREQHKKTRKQDSEKEKERLYEDYNFRMAKYLRNSVRLAFQLYCKKKIIRKSRKYHLNYEGIIFHLLKTKPKDYDFNPRKYEIDHIKPLCSFDFNIEGEMKKAFLPCNHQWLSCKQNFIKARNDRKKSKWQD